MRSVTENLDLIPLDIAVMRVLNEGGACTITGSPEAPELAFSFFFVGDRRPGPVQRCKIFVAARSPGRADIKVLERPEFRNRLEYAKAVMAKFSTSGEFSENLKDTENFGELAEKLAGRVLARRTPEKKGIGELFDEYESEKLAENSEKSGEVTTETFRRTPHGELIGHDGIKASTTAQQFIAGMLMDNDESEAALQIEARFGSHAFDTCLTGIRFAELYNSLRDFAVDEKDNKLGNVLDLVTAFTEHPSEANRKAMADACAKYGPRRKRGR